MTLASDPQNNTLVITAPVQLADEVERLALTLDRHAQSVQHESAQVIQVIASKNAGYVRGAVREFLNDRAPDSAKNTDTAANKR
jgi:hypothetical protein